MQVEVPGPAEPFAHRLTDQRVGHAQAAGAVLDQQSGGDGVVGGVEQAVTVEAAGGDEHRQRGRLTGDGGQVEDLRDDGIEAVEPDTEHRPHRFRQIITERALGVLDQLGEEEGVAAGRGVELVGVLCVATVQRQQFADLVGGEAPDRDARERALARQRGSDAVQLRGRVVGR